MHPSAPLFSLLSPQRKPSPLVKSYSAFFDFDRSDLVGSASYNLHPSAESANSQLVADGTTADGIATVRFSEPVASKRSNVRVSQDRLAIFDLGQGPTS
jgi:hypothetical protein